MHGDGSHVPSIATHPPRDTGEVLFYSSPLEREMHAAIQQLHARTRTSLTQREATDLVREVAGLMAQEQSFGSFGEPTSVVGADLSGGCCIAAAVTALVLRHRGHHGWVVGGTPLFEDQRRSNHWWAQTTDGWVLDPTWGQFRWCIDPLAAPSTELLYANRYVYPREFMRWRGHPTLPTSHRTVVDRLLMRLIGAPYVWE